MDIVENILGKNKIKKDGCSKNQSNTLCEICGEHRATTSAMIPLWDYGVRNIKSRKVCRSCFKAHKEGIL